jgi:putative aldouronate transport system substrate-binding protein
MMKKSMRLLALLLTVAMLAALACGCGSSTSTTETTTETTAETTTEETTAASEAPAAEEDAAPAEEAAPAEDAAPAEEETPAEPENPDAELQHGVYRTYSEAEALPLTDEPVTLKAWDYVVPPMMAVINDYGTDGLVYSTIQELTGINLEFTTANLLTASDSMALMVNANELPDIIFDFGMFYSGSMEDLVDGEIIIDFNDYEDLMPNYYDIMNNNSLIYLDSVTDSGYMPLAENIQDSLIPSAGPVVRQDWLDELGLDVPETIDELYDVLIAFRDEKDCAHPIWINAAGSNPSIANAYGISTEGSNNSLAGWIYKDGEMQFCVTMPEYKEYIELMADWYAQGLIDPDFISYNVSNAAEDSQITGNSCGVWNTSVNGMTNLSGYEPDVDVEPVRRFVLNSGDEGHFDDAGSSQIGKGGTAIACSNPEIELSVQLIDYFYSEDGIILQNYGTEGYSYEIVDGEPQLTELVTNNPDGLAFAQALIKYTSSTPSSVTINSRNYLGYSDAQVKAITDWIADGELYQAPGQNWDVDAQSEFNSLVTDMNTYADTELLSFITGNKSLDEWDSFIENLTSSFDIDRMKELSEEAIDSYLSKLNG